MGFDLYGIAPATNEAEPIWEGPEPYIKHGKHSSIRNPEIDNDIYQDYILDKIEWDDNIKGARFRNTAWDWRPLWELVCNTCMDILTPEDCKAGESNDFHVITKDKAMRIGTRLDQHLESGFVEKYVRDRDKEIAEEGSLTNIGESYSLWVENVERFAEFCKFSGGFKIG